MPSSSSSYAANSSAGGFRVKFPSIGWYRFIPYLGYHHVLMGFIIVALVLQCILVAGCTSENLNGIYLFSLSYTDRASTRELSASEVNANASVLFSSLAGNGTSLQVRSGYFGMCLSTGTGWICSRSSSRLASIVQGGSSGVDSGLGDPMNLIYAAAKFKSDVVFVGLIFISIPFSFITCCLLKTFPGWHEEENSEGSAREVKPFPSRPVSQIALACVGLSALMALLATFWQHMAGVAASTMAEVFTYGAAKGGVGAGAMVCGWVSFALLMIAALGLLVMILSIRVLSQIT